MRTAISGPLGTKASIAAPTAAPATVPRERSTALAKTEPRSGFITSVTVSGTQNQCSPSRSQAAAPTSFPIETGVIDQSTPAGPIRGVWAKIQLDPQRVRVLVTAPLPAATRALDPAGTEAHLRTVPEWADAQGATLAVNANFFSKVIARPPGEADPGEGRGGGERPAGAVSAL